MARFVEVADGRFVNPDLVADVFEDLAGITGTRTTIVFAGGGAAMIYGKQGIEVVALLSEPCDVCAERVAFNDAMESR